MKRLIYVCCSSVFFVGLPSVLHETCGHYAGQRSFTITYGSNVATFMLPSSPMPTGTNRGVPFRFSARVLHQRRDGGR